MKLKVLTIAEIQEVIDAATALEAAFPEDEADPSSQRDLSRARAYIASPERKRLVESISSLTDPARHELMALVWYGRHEWQATFEQFLEDAITSSGPGDVGYLADKSPALPAYLQRGLKQLDEADDNA